MKTKATKILSFLLVIALCFAFIPVGSAAADSGYSVILNANGGVMLANQTQNVAPGTVVIVSVHPQSGYNVSSVTVTGYGELEPKLRNLKFAKTYAFIMPEGDVTVSAAYTPCINKKYADVANGQWYTDSVTYTTQREFFSGYGNSNLFGVTDSIQRQDFLVVLAKMDGADLSVYDGRHSSFPDVPADSYFEKAIIWGTENGIVSGYQNGNFGVSDYITREQIVTFFYRYASAKRYNTYRFANAGTTYSAKYSDYKKISAYANEAVLWALDNGIISGKSGKYIDPSGNAQRCEIAGIINNIADNYIFEYCTYTQNGTEVNTLYPANVKPQKLIAEVVKYQGETFNGGTLDDLSWAYNNYLPQGTVDYASPNLVHCSGAEYIVTKHGKRLYTSNSSGQVIKTYYGSLPEKNHITTAWTSETDRYTTIAFNVDWRAPFELQLKDQNYNSDRSISAVTFSYLDIRFNYSCCINGLPQLDPDNPIFSSVQVIRNDKDYTLRFYLRSPGKFYGWYASYNADNQLEFRFLKPVKVPATTANSYGVTLDGTRIVIDPGHGGTDGGAGSCSGGMSEAAVNLDIAQRLKSKLESFGATVIMTRSSNVGLSQENRNEILITANADLLISIHCNSSTSKSAKGFKSYYFNAFSKELSDIMCNKFQSNNIFGSASTSGFHYFYMCRNTVCPSVLTENGFLSNSGDNAKLQDPSHRDAIAQNIFEGTVKYFRDR